MLTTYQNFVLIYGTVVKLLPCYFFIHSLFWNKSVTFLLHLVLETWDHENVKIWPFYLMIVFIPSYKLFLLLNYVFFKVFTMCLIFMNTVGSSAKSFWNLIKHYYAWLLIYHLEALSFEINMEGAQIMVRLYIIITKLLWFCWRNSQ